MKRENRSSVRRVKKLSITPPGLTADTVNSALDDVAGKPIVDRVLPRVVQDVVELKPEAVLAVVVHSVSRCLRLVIQR